LDLDPQQQLGVEIGFFSGIFTTIGIMKFVFPEPFSDSRLLLASMFAILGAALVGALIEEPASAAPI